MTYAARVASVVQDPEWQALRKSFLGRWKTRYIRCLFELRQYLGPQPWVDEDKLLRVYNLMTALRRGGLDNSATEHLLRDVVRASNYLQTL